MTAKRTVKKKKPYVISITMGDKTYKGEGETALEALQSIDRPLKIFLKGVVTIQTEKDERKILLMPINLKRLFYPSAQPYLIKRFTFGMK